jgi:hypothetical protein
MVHEEGDTLTIREPVSAAVITETVPLSRLVT